MITEDELRHRLRTSARISMMVDTPPRLPMPRYYLVRLYVALSVLTNCLVAYYEPQSLTAQVLRGSPTGWACLALLFAFGLFGVCDVVVNDLMPRRFTLPAARSHRHLGYMAIAIATLGLTYAVLKERGYTALLLAYWVDAGFAAGVACLDLFARHRGHA